MNQCRCSSCYQIFDLVRKECEWNVEFRIKRSKYSWDIKLCYCTVVPYQTRIINIDKSVSDEWQVYKQCCHHNDDIRVVLSEHLLHRSMIEIFIGVDDNIVIPIS